MINTMANPHDIRLMLPESIWLEPEHFAQARQQVRQQRDRFAQESEQWQAYLKTLAQLAFYDWLQERLSDCQLLKVERAIARIGYLNAGQFKLGIIPVEHVLDEQVDIPRIAVDQPELCAHYYVWIEVLEEEQEAVIRGFLSYTELAERLNATVQLAQPAESYRLPLTVLDSEPNHLVSYVQRLSPAAIALPAASVSHAADSVGDRLSTLTTHLSQWLSGSLSEGWQALDSLANPQRTLALATRSNPNETAAGKVINLGVQIQAREVILLVTVAPKDEKVNVSVQVLPTGTASVLPPQLSVVLLSNKEKVLQEVTSREQDNFIQLKPFKGKPGVRFSVALSLDGTEVREAFEL